MKEKKKDLAPLVFISAGEASGDLIGKHLMGALKKIYPQIRFMGIGGELMAQEGLVSLFPMEKLSLLGIFEILPRVCEVLGLVHHTVEEILKTQPDLVVTIDNPAFNFRVGRKLKKALRYKKTIPHVHYGAPTVWAWRPKRAEKCAQFLDHLLALFPFEPPYFEKEGLPTTFVGHPLLEESIQNDTRSLPHNRCKQKNSPQEICLLPGSRLSEVKRLLPLFLEALVLLSKRGETFAVTLPTFSSLKGAVCEIIGRNTLPFEVRVVEGPQEKKKAFRESQIALAASGTVALELARYGLPCVIGYKVNRFSGWIARKMIKIPFVSMPNILLNRGVIHEFLQNQCTPERVANAMEQLLKNPRRQEDQRKDFGEVISLLQAPSGTPSEMAALTLKSILDKRKEVLYDPCGN